jgi:predicted unusual protein kinase regulating ubiquinone biosynthesis (AarF/ABC1/UbiB family)
LGIQATLHQLVVTGVLHADPHPGNLLLSGDSLVYLDFGLLVRVPPDTSMVSPASPTPARAPLQW